LKYNKPLIAVVLGFLSTIPYETFTQISIYYGIGKYSLYHLTSLMVTLNRPRIILGLLMSFLVASTISVFFYYSTKILGTDYLISKSILISLIAWGIIETLFVAIIEGPQLINPRPINDYYLHMIGNIIFGLTMGILFKKYLFKNPIKTA